MYGCNVHDIWNKVLAYDKKKLKLKIVHILE